MIYVGIDNGISGSIGIIDEAKSGFQIKTPTRSCLNYQKSKVKHITRVDFKTFRDILYEAKSGAIAMIERPMVNPQRFEATTSALRALEATLIVLESLGIGYQYCKS